MVYLAARIEYRRIGTNWFLQIIPRYFFTEDGEKPWDNELVGPYTTMLKAKERNGQVLNHVLFWSDVLSRRRPEIGMLLDGKVILRIGKLPVVGMAPFGIPDDPAIYEEKSVSGQLPFLDDIEVDGDEEDEDDEY